MCKNYLLYPFILNAWPQYRRARIFFLYAYEQLWKGLYPFLTLFEIYNPLSYTIIDKSYKWLYFQSSSTIYYIILKLIRPEKSR